MAQHSACQESSLKPPQLQSLKSRTSFHAFTQPCLNCDPRKQLIIDNTLPTCQQTYRRVRLFLSVTMLIAAPCSALMMDPSEFLIDRQNTLLWISMANEIQCPSIASSLHFWMPTLVCTTAQGANNLIHHDRRQHHPQLHRRPMIPRSVTRLLPHPQIHASMPTAHFALWEEVREDGQSGFQPSWTLSWPQPLGGSPVVTASD